MNILQVAPIMDPDNLWTGPHRVVFDISKRLSEMGNKVTVCTSDMSDRTTRIKSNPQSVSDGFEIVRVRNLSRHFYRTSGLLVTPDLGRFLSERIRDYDVIHVHEYMTYQNIIVHKFAKKYKIPYILQVHGSLPILEKTVRKWLYYVSFGSRLLVDASKVIALSQTEAERYRALRVPRRKIAVVPNGIDLSEYVDLPPIGSFKKKSNIQDDKKIILYLGRVHRSKGIGFLIKAYAYLVSTMKLNDVLLVIAGPDDGYLAEANSLSHSLGIADSTLFTGFISAEDKREALVDASVFVTPSFYGFPLTFLEACAVGTPIVATTLGDRLEWINGNVGYVTPPNYHKLAKAMYRIISNNELADKFSRNGKEIVGSEFSLEKTVDRLEQVYKEVAEVSQDRKPKLPLVSALSSAHPLNMI